MRNETNANTDQQADQTPEPGADQGASAATAGTARTDDLLASGAEAKDGARGFEVDSNPQALQTGMEGIAEAAAGAGKPGAARPD